MYLTEPAIDAVLATVATFPPGSEMVLTFAQPRSPAAEPARTPRGPTLAVRAAEIGEPWLSYFTPDAMERKLLAAGFRSVEFLMPGAAAAYFHGGADGLPVPRRTSVVGAIR
jgi:O-methyltransferase involved in polyketide biosynthesis